MKFVDTDRCRLYLHGMTTDNRRNLPRRPVETPKGQFSGIKAASEAHGVHRQTVWINCKRGVPGWRFLAADPFPRKQTPDWLTWNVEEIAE